MSGNDEPAPIRGFRRAAYLLLAMVFLTVGLLGVVLPGLPTTPFLLVMSYFLIRSSPLLHERIVRVPLVGRHIREWREQRGVRLHVKILASVMVLAVVGLSLASSTVILPIKVGILLCAAFGVAFVWRLPTIA